MQGSRYTVPGSKAVVYSTLQGFGHGWPDGNTLPELIGGPTDSDFDATARQLVLEQGYDDTGGRSTSGGRCGYFESWSQGRRRICFERVEEIAMTGDDYPLEGHCACRTVRYRLLAAPLFVHCCHCSWCQRETGSAFAINALIERRNVEVLDGEPRAIHNPSNSGIGQDILRCPDCWTAVWSHYGTARDKISFVRVGTLVDPSRCPPDIHIFTSSRQPWVTLNDGKPAMANYYDRDPYWPAESLGR